MPILAPEPSIYPDHLLKDFSEEPCERSWWAIYTKARQEKALARHLHAQQVPFYLPLVGKENLIRGKRVASQIPLFSGYMFLYGSDEERVKSLTSNRISTILPVVDGAQLRSELASVQQLIEADAPLTVERRLMPGQQVRIKAGSMMGLEGTVIRHRGRTRLLLSVSFLQQGVSIEIDGFLLEPIG